MTQRVRLLPVALLIIVCSIAVISFNRSRETHSANAQDTIERAPPHLLELKTDGIISHSKHPNSAPIITIEDRSRWLEDHILKLVDESTTIHLNGTGWTETRVVEADGAKGPIRIEESYVWNEKRGTYSLHSYSAMAADTLLIQAKQSTQISELEVIIKEAGARTLNPIGNQGLYKVGLPNSNLLETFSNTKAALGYGSEFLSFVEPNYLLTASGTIPSDPEFDRQRSLEDYVHGDRRIDINATLGWDIRTDASSVVVAVIDSGIRATHDDLEGNLWENASDPIDGLDNDNNGYIDDRHGINAILMSNDLTDEDGHGTAIAGLIGAVGNNEIGISGVAWRTQLMPLKFLNKNGFGETSDAITCIDYAIEMSADIINASWGGQEYSQSLKDAIERSDAANILFVTASGNEGKNIDIEPSYPAAYDNSNILSVAATGFEGQISNYSNRGLVNVDVVAPGGSLISLSHESDSGLSHSTGTSGAAALVSGLAALTKAESNQDEPQLLKDRIINSARLRSDYTDHIRSGGMVDLERALLNESNAPNNDQFSARESLPPQSILKRGSFSRASAESGEPNPGTLSELKSVWYTFSLSQSQEIGLRLESDIGGANIALYRGDSIASLDLIRSQSTSDNLAEFTESLDSGIEYNIQVSGDEQSGGFEFSFFTPPQNDNFESAISLSGDRVSSSGSNLNATLQSGEKRLSSRSIGKTLWWEYTADRDSEFLFSTEGSATDTILAAYSGDELSTLQRLRLNDNASNSLTYSQISITVKEGSKYYIAVDSMIGGGGDIALIGQFISNIRFISTPSNQFAALGESARFQTRAIGPPPLSYQWFFNGNPLSDATLPVLKIETVSEQDYGEYYVEVNSSAGIIRSDKVMLSRHGSKPEIIKQPDFLHITEGDDCNLHVVATGSGDLSYQWYKNTQPIAGATSQKYQISNAKSDDGGYYKVEVSNSFGTTQSSVVRVQYYGEDKPKFIPRLTTGREGFTRDIVWFIDRFVAIGWPGKIATSADGYNWTHLPSIDEDASPYSLVVGDDLIIARTQYSGEFYTSSDLINWTKSSIAGGDTSFFGSTDVVFQNGVFAVIGGNRGIHTSTDGVNWVKRHQLAKDNGPFSIVAANGFFMAAISGDNDIEFATSSDGVTWESTTTPEFGGFYGAIGRGLYGFQDKIVLYTNQTWVTENGTDWESIAGNGSFTGAEKIGDYYYGLPYGTSDLYKSTDLVDWELVFDPGSIDYDNQELFYAHHEGLFVVGPVEGSIIPFRDPAAIERPGYGKNIPTYLSSFDIEFYNGKFYTWDGNLLASSETGSKWTYETVTASGSYFEGISGLAFGDQSFHVGTAFGPSIEDLTTIERPEGKYPRIAAYGEGVFVGHTYSEVFYYTKEEGWNQAQTANFDQIEEIIFAGSRFIGVGDSGRILRSENGIEWTDNLVGGSFSRVRFTDVTFDGGKYIASTNEGDLYTSTQGIDWNKLEVNFNSLLNSDNVNFIQIQYGDGRYVIIAENFILESTNLTNWSFEEFDGLNISDLTYGNGTFIAVGPGQRIFQYGKVDHLLPTLEVSPKSIGFLQQGDKARLNIKSEGTFSNIANVTIFINGVPVTERSHASFDFDWSANETGIYDVVVEATDTNGMSTRESRSIVVYKGDSIDLLASGTPIGTRGAAKFRESVYTLSQSGQIYRSSNLLDWELCYIPSQLKPTRIHATNSAVIALSENGAYSTTDGINWKYTAIKSNWSSDGNSNNPEWVFIRDSSTPTYRSRDGLDWKQIDSDVIDSLNDILCEHNGDYLIKSDAGKLTILDSLGQSRKINLPIHAAPSSAISDGGSVFLAFQDSTEHRKRRFFSSSDLENWTENASITEIHSHTDTFEHVDGLFVFAGQYISQDGLESWTKLFDVINLQFIEKWNDSFYATGTGLPNWGIIRSENGLDWTLAHQATKSFEGLLGVESGLVSWDSTNHSGYGVANLWASNTGSDWRHITGLSSGFDYYQDIDFGHAGYLAISESSIAKSNGNDWIIYDKPEEFENTLAYGKGKYVAVTENQQIAISTDGQNWVFKDVPEFGLWTPNRIEFLESAGLFVCGPILNGFLTSSDGETWTAKSHGEGYHGSLRLTGGVLFMEYSSTVRATTDGENWSEIPKIRYPDNIHFNLGQFIASTGDFRDPLYASENGFDWTSVDTPVTSNVSAINLVKDGFLVYFGTQGFRTLDGISWEEFGEPSRGGDSIYLNDQIFYISQSISIASDTDLKLKSAYSDPNTLGISDSLDIKLEVENLGSSSINLEGVETEVRLASSSTWTGDSGKLIGRVNLEPRLIEAGEVAEIDVSLALPETVTPGIYGLQIWLNPSQLIKEINVNNNYAWTSSLNLEIPSYYLDVESVAGGQIIVEPTRERYPKGAIVSLFPKSNKGFNFSNWTLDAQEQGRDAQILMNADKSVGAVFSQNYSSWIHTVFNPEQTESSSISGYDADPDLDNFSNFTEYTFGTDPLDAASRPAFEIYHSDGMLHSEFSKRASALEAVTLLESSTNLADWSTENAIETSLSIENGIEKVRVSLPLTEKGNVFLKISVGTKSEIE